MVVSKHHSLIDVIYPQLKNVGCLLPADVDAYHTLEEKSRQKFQFAEEYHE